MHKYLYVYRYLKRHFDVFHYVEFVELLARNSNSDSGRFDEK